MNAEMDSGREYDFALVVGGIAEMNDDVLDTLIGAGCDDATFSMTYGLVFAEFSRRAESLLDAIVSAIRDVRSAGVGAEVRGVHECSLVSQAEIARRTGRSRQQVNQYISGARGPGGFPAPICNLTEGQPLYKWCDVTHWLVENNLARSEQHEAAMVVHYVNLSLELESEGTKGQTLFGQVRRSLSNAQPRELAAV